VISLTPEEFEANLEKPALRYALSRGSAIVVDDYGVSKAMARRGIEFTTAEQLKSRIASAIEALPKASRSAEAAEKQGTETAGDA